MDSISIWAGWARARARARGARAPVLVLLLSLFAACLVVLVLCSCFAHFIGSRAVVLDCWLSGYVPRFYRWGAGHPHSASDFAETYLPVSLFSRPGSNTTR